MNLNVEQLAARAQTLLADDVLNHVMEAIREEQVATMLSRTVSEQQALEARQMVWALDALKARLQSLVDDKAFAARRNGAAPR